MAVIVVHPQVQHSRGLALALHDERLLSRFVTSLDGSIADRPWLPATIRRKLSARAVEGIPAEMVTTFPYLEVLWLLGRPMFGERLLYLTLAGFDRWARSAVSKSGARIVVGFENSCLRVFQRAKAAGMACVLDAASIHHSAQRPEPGRGASALLERTNRRKDEEVQLADRIVVLSTYSFDSYAAAGVPTEKLSLVPPALPAQWRDTPMRERRTEGLRFLYVGNIKYAKGIDLLLKAFTRLNAAGKRLVMVGRMAEEGALPARLPDGAEYKGPLSGQALMEAYRNSDVLVLPSRGDGFGFVVAEAMAAGLPAIVSSAVGAKDLVENGRNGWIFPSEDVDGLLQAMSAACELKGGLAEMGAHAREATASLTWEAYRARIGTLYGELLSARLRAAAI